MIVVEYPKNLDAFQQGNIRSWATSNKLDFVLEIHFNAFNRTATGTEIIKQSIVNHKYINDLVSNISTLLKIPNRGVKNRSDLANLNRMSGSGINYALLETHFGDNPNDHNSANKNKVALGNLIFNLAQSNGIRRLGVVYGHGQNDSGAIASDRTSEANWVRSLKIVQSNIGNEVSSNMFVTRHVRNGLILINDEKKTRARTRVVSRTLPKKGQRLVQDETITTSPTASVVWEGYFPFSTHGILDPSGRQVDVCRVQTRDGWRFIAVYKSVDTVRQTSFTNRTPEK